MSLIKNYSINLKVYFYSLVNLGLIPEVTWRKWKTCQSNLPVCFMHNEYRVTSLVKKSIKQCKHYFKLEKKMFLKVFTIVKNHSSFSTIPTVTSTPSFPLPVVRYILRKKGFKLQEKMVFLFICFFITLLVAHHMLLRAIGRPLLWWELARTTAGCWEPHWFQGSCVALAGGGSQLPRPWELGETCSASTGGGREPHCFCERWAHHLLSRLALGSGGCRLASFLCLCPLWL